MINILHHLFYSEFYHFTHLPILAGYIKIITNYDYDEYFSVSTWGESGGSCYAKVKYKYHTKQKEINVELKIVIGMCVY